MLPRLINKKIVPWDKFGVKLQAYSCLPLPSLPYLLYLSLIYLYLDRLGLLEMMHQEQSSLVSLVVPDTPESWLVWAKRMHMLEMKLSLREVF